MSMKERHPQRVKCPCGKMARRIVSHSISFSRGACAFEPHFNVCLGEPVYSERHMRDVEKRLEDRTGIRAVPYEKVRDRSSDWQEKGQAGARGAALANAQTDEPWGREYDGEEGVAEEVRA